VTAAKELKHSCAKVIQLYDGCAANLETASRTVPCDRGLRVADLDADALGDVRGSQGAGDGLTDGAERAPGGAAHRLNATDLAARDPGDLLQLAQLPTSALTGTNGTVTTAAGGHRHVRRQLALIEFGGGRPDSFRTG
jgi:hypothetical protein